MYGLARPARTVSCELAAAGVLGLVLGGCGSSTPTLDTAAVQRAIAATILTERHVQTTVQCPSGVQRKAGITFTCTAKLDAGTYPVTVTQKDGDGHVRYANAAPFVVLNTAKIERAIAASMLAQRKLHGTVSCPANVLQQAGLHFVCKATVAGRVYPFEVTQTDGSGRVSYVGR
jgi:hypothetical protein